MNPAKKKSLPPFVPMYVHVMESPAWRSMSVGARALFLALKKRYHRQKQCAVYLSTRDAAKELRAGKSTVLRFYREAEHFGFILKVKQAVLGADGLAAHYKLTDEPYLGKPASKEFSFWSGAPYVPNTGHPVPPQVHTRMSHNRYIRRKKTQQNGVRRYVP